MNFIFVLIFESFLYGVENKNQKTQLHELFPKCCTARMYNVRQLRCRIGTRVLTYASLSLPLVVDKLLYDIALLSNKEIQVDWCVSENLYSVRRGEISRLVHYAFQHNDQ